MRARDEYNSIIDRHNRYCERPRETGGYTIDYQEQVNHMLVGKVTYLEHVVEKLQETIEELQEKKEELRETIEELQETIEGLQEIIEER